MIAGNHKPIVTKLEIVNSYKTLSEVTVSQLYHEVVRWTRGEQQAFVLDAIGIADLCRDRLRGTRSPGDGWARAARLGGSGVH